MCFWAVWEAPTVPFCKAIWTKELLKHSAFQT